MATYNDVVTYQDLIDNVIDKISSFCINVGLTQTELNSKIPDHIRPGYSWILDNNQSCWVKATVSSNSLCKPVALTTVKDQFNAFLNERGLLAKNNEVITFKGLMNFYVNAASFLSSRIVLVGNSMYVPDIIDDSSFTAQDSLNTEYAKAFYNSDDVTYNYYNNWDNSNNFQYGKNTYTANDIQNDISNLIKSISNDAGVEYAKTTLTFGCCSSSSSSSSSSCSSSSSLFVAYMEI